MFRYLILLTLAVYGRTLTHALLWWDDQKNICNNTFFNFPVVEGLKALWSQPFFGLYIPVSYTVWFATAGVGELLMGGTCNDWAPVFHALNLLLHLANGWMVYRLLKKVLPAGTPAAALAAGVAVFLLHPLQAESVAWVSSGRDLIATFFGLAALLVYGGEKPLWSLPLFAFALLAKPVGVVFPVLALLLEKPKWQVLAPAGVMAAALSLYTKSIQADELLRFKIQFWQRPLIALHSLGFYTVKFLVPWPLVPSYARSIPQLQSDGQLWWVAGALLVPVAAAIYIPATRKPFLWMAVALAPVLGLVSFGFQEISTVADRFMYVPMIGGAWLAAVLISRAKKPWKLVGGAWLAVLAVLAFVQSGYWHSDEQLFDHVIAVNDSSIAHANLANVYYHRDELARAEPEYKVALAHNPQLYDAWLGLARVYEMTNRVNEAEQTYRQAIEAGMAQAPVFNNLGTLLFKRGDPQCEVYWREAVKRDPLYMEPLYNLGLFFRDHQRKQESLEFFRRALSVAPLDRRILEQIRTTEAQP